MKPIMKWARKFVRQSRNWVAHFQKFAYSQREHSATSKKGTKAAARTFTTFTVRGTREDG
jgi:hypothetical protein